MRCITVRLPWGAAIRAGVKLVENRGRPVAAKHIGQLFAIHAAAAWCKRGASDPRILDWWWGNHPRRAPLDATDFAPYFRKVLAVGTLANCHEAQPRNGYSTCCLPWGDRDYNDRPDVPAQHLVFEEMVALPTPVGPVAGHLWVPWTLPDDVAAQVEAQLATPVTS